MRDRGPTSVLCRKPPQPIHDTGPGSPSVKSNMLVSIEQHVDFVTESTIYMREHGLELMEPDVAAEDDWVDHVQEAANKTLFPRANSRYMGANISASLAFHALYRRGRNASLASAKKWLQIIMRASASRRRRLLQPNDERLQIFALRCF